jgi:hypothetical protein
VITHTLSRGPVKFIAAVGMSAKGHTLNLPLCGEVGHRPPTTVREAIFLLFSISLCGKDHCRDQQESEARNIPSIAGMKTL